VTFTFTVTNPDTNPATLDLWLSSEGPQDRTRLSGSGTIGAGETVTRMHPQTIPASYPPGSYDVALNIGDFGTLDVCDSANFTFTVGVERESHAYGTKAEAAQAEATRGAAAPAPALRANAQALVFEEVEPMS